MANDETGISMVPEDGLRWRAASSSARPIYGIPQEDVNHRSDRDDGRRGSDVRRDHFGTMRLIRDQLGNNMTVGASTFSFGLPDAPSSTQRFFHSRCTRV